MATIKKRGNSYLIRCSVGYDLDGKQIRKNFTWNIPENMSEEKAKKEAERQAILIEDKISRGIALDSKVKFAELSNRWYNEYVEKALKKTTSASYGLIIKRINKSIGNIQLDKLTPFHIMAFLDDLQKPQITKLYVFKGDLKKELSDRKMLQLDLIKKHNISKWYIKCVKDKTPIPLEAAKPICKALNCDLNEYFDVIEKEFIMSAKTIKNYHLTISSILNKGIRWGLVANNVANVVDTPRIEHKEQIILDEQDIDNMLNALKNEPFEFQVLIELILFTGMRRGEALGLKWEDFNMFRKSIYVHRTILYDNIHNLYESTPKTRNSVRFIAISSYMVNRLNELKKLQDERKEQLLDYYDDKGFIFASDTGSPLYPNTVGLRFRRFIDENNLPPIHLHSLRHTNASLLIANGINIETVASRLGHCDSTTTSRVYAHALASANVQASETLDDIIFKSKDNVIEMKKII